MARIPTIEIARIGKLVPEGGDGRNRYGGGSIVPVLYPCACLGDFTE